MNNKKYFQILNGFCHWDATSTLNIQESLEEEIVDKFSPDLQFVEAPWYVREGWGFDETKTGDERFIPPTPPNGWYYNLDTGTFMPLEEMDYIIIVQEDGSPKKVPLEEYYANIDNNENL